MKNTEVTTTKDDCHIAIGISSAESFNFKSGMEECMRHIAYVKVNGIAIEPHGLFEFMELEELNKLLGDV